MRLPDGKEIKAPVQLSASGIRSIHPSNIFLPDGSSYIQHMPGAPAVRAFWWSYRDLLL